MPATGAEIEPLHFVNPHKFPAENLILSIKAELHEHFSFVILPGILTYNVMGVLRDDLQTGQGQSLALPLCFILYRKSK